MSSGRVSNQKAPAKSGGFAFIISPPVVMAIIWFVSILVFFIANSVKDDLLYLRYMSQVERIQDDATALSFIWLLLALTVFSASAAFGMKLRIRPTTTTFNYQKAARGVLIVFGFTLLISFLWIGVAIIQLGGIARMAALAASENAVARSVLLSAAFPGGRLVATGFIGLAVFCSFVIGRPRPDHVPSRELLPFIVVLGVCIAYLGVIPIIMSGRVNFFTAVIASYIAACIPNRRFIGIGLLPIPIALLALVWGITDYFALHGVVEVSPVEQATQGLLFYFYNDISNALNPIGKLEGHYAYGWNSLRFLFFFTFTDKAILDATIESRTFMLQFRHGGEYPLLTAPYIDFSFLGIIIISLLGIICGREYKKAMMGEENSSVYGIIFACLVLSVHASYLTNHEIFYNIMLCTFLSRYGRVKN